jgi:predicted metal-dependent HD superfamily phosphohydrolase
VISPERLESMQTGWVRLLAHYSVGPAAAYPVFDRLVAAHSEPHRFYHTLEHVHEVLKVAGKLAEAAADPSAVHLAIWFHDAVYDSRATDNEERSAVLAVDLLGPLGVPEDTLRHVAALIRTTTHTAVGEVDSDTAVLLDADLAILSAEDRRYARYAADVRREYAWVEDAAYRAGRIKVLQGFLDRPRIYRTERMRAVAEEAARKNLRAEIEQLRGLTGEPGAPHDLRR